MNLLFNVFFLGLLPLLGIFTISSCTEDAVQPTQAGPGDSTLSDTIPVYSYEIVNTYPHNRDAFTQGLVFENGFLYEGTGIPGHSSLRKVELETGEIKQIYFLPVKYFGEGITVFNNNIVQLTWLSRIGFVYDMESFELLDDFGYSIEGWGITHDGENLIMSDGTSTLHYIDPRSYVEIGQIEVYAGNDPVSNLNELEYIGGKIYANVWLTDLIAIIEPRSGKVVGWINLEGLLSPEDMTEPVDVLNGIAYDPEGERLFVTGKWWPRLFEIELVEAD